MAIFLSLFQYGDRFPVYWDYYYKDKTDVSSSHLILFFTGRQGCFHSKKSLQKWDISLVDIFWNNFQHVWNCCSGYMSFDVNSIWMYLQTMHRESSHKCISLISVQLFGNSLTHLTGNVYSWPDGWGWSGVVATLRSNLISNQSLTRTCPWTPSKWWAETGWIWWKSSIIKPLGSKASWCFDSWFNVMGW